MVWAWANNGRRGWLYPVFAADQEKLTVQLISPYAQRRPGASALLCCALVVAAGGGGLGISSTVLAQAQPSAAAPTQAPPVATATKAKAKAKTKPGAETTAAATKAPKKDPALAQQQIDQGVASLQAGKVDLAVQQLSTALTGGSLPPNLMAKAYYQRGIAYRKQTKPALAISDLTSALWLKGGLNDTERSDALQNRSAAYRDAGLPDQADADQVASGPAAQQKTRQTIAPASDTATASLPAKLVPAPAPSVGLAPPDAPQTGGGLGGFFGNLFGSGSTPAAAAPAPSSKPEPAVSAWSTGTEVKPAPGAPTRAAAAVIPTTATTAPVAKTGQRFLLQVAQLRSREEAQAVAGKLKQQLGADLAGREASIDSAVVGNMGTLHRVRFGPFADASEWRSLCPKLLSAGHDCQPLPQ